MAKRPKDPSDSAQPPQDAAPDQTGSELPIADSTPEASATPMPESGQSADEAQEVTQSDIDALMSAAGEESTRHAEPAGTSEFTQPFVLPDLAPTASGGVDVKRITMLNDVKLRVKIELGRTRMLVEDVLQLGEGSVVELDKLAGDPVDVYANERLIARGEVLVLNESFCVRINEVLSRDPHRVSA